MLLKIMYIQGEQIYLFKINCKKMKTCQLNKILKKQK